jgi:hypothetical protein
MPYYYDEYETLKQQKQQKQNKSQNNKSIMRYYSKVMESIVTGNNANNKQVCCIDFLINDIANLHYTKL